jgi:hypothetical protein
MPPREFFGKAWTGDGEVTALPAFLWRRFAVRYRVTRDAEWLNDGTFIMHDRAEAGGRVEERRLLCEFDGPSRIRISATQLPDGVEVLLEDDGYRIVPYRAQWPIGPARITLHCRDEGRVESDGTLVNTITGRWLGLFPVARLTTRGRLVA